MSTFSRKKRHAAAPPGAPVKAMDRPIGWLPLLLVVAGLAGGGYLAWLWLWPRPEPVSLVETFLQIAAETAAAGGEHAELINDPGFFTNFSKGARIERSKAETEDSPAPKLNDAKAPGKAPAGMVWVPGGEFYMGTNARHPLLVDARPSHLVYVDGFWMSDHETTNEEFQRFIAETKYITTAEKPPPKYDVVDPKIDKKLLTDPWSFVFVKPKERIDDWSDPTQWWQPVFDANWKHPEGPKSSIAGKEKHPVVQVSWDDAVQYCLWLSKKTGKTVRLPSEAEWEFAARGGLDRKPFVWGDEKDPGGKCYANYWQGEFPNEDTKKDGYHGTAPVGSFPANGYGLHDMAGNVWEWCADFYQPDYYRTSPARNPAGPTRSDDVDEPTTRFRVTRGGSFLCADNYCQRFIPAARNKTEQNAAYVHIGFRVVMEP